MARIEGTVTKIEGQHSWVDAGEAGRFSCDLRGKLSKRGNVRLAVGDRVVLTDETIAPEPAAPAAGVASAPGDGAAPRRQDPGTRIGIIEEVLERTTELRRPRSYKRDQVLCANVDQVLVVIAAYDPPYKRNFLDRLLVAIEREGLEPVIVFNKLDLADAAYRAVVENDARVYVRLGYKVVGTSTVSGEGIEDLRRILSGRISAVTGGSGVGKSTLLNVLVPGLTLRTGEVSESSGRGKHTTTAAELVPIPGGGFVADTPGLRAFALADVAARELPRCYRELAKLGEGCKFKDCSHREEPGCVVQPAVESGEIDEERFDSYLRLREELEAEDQKSMRKR